MFLLTFPWFLEVFNPPLSSNCRWCSAKQTTWFKHCSCDIATVFSNGRPSYSFGVTLGCQQLPSKMTKIQNWFSKWYNIDGVYITDTVFCSPDWVLECLGQRDEPHESDFVTKNPIQRSLILHHAAWYHRWNGWLINAQTKSMTLFSSAVHRLLLVIMCTLRLYHY